MTDITADLKQIYRAVEYLTDLEGQDRTLVIEMSQAMLSDVINSQYRGGGVMFPVTAYILKYCDVLDSPNDVDRIAAAITNGDPR